MVDGTFDDIVADLVRRQPDPPRNAPWRDLVATSYRDRAAHYLVGCGVAIGLAGVIVAVVASGSLVERSILFVGGLVGLGLFVGAPALRALRYIRALRSGISVRAEVISVSWAAPGIRPPTIEAGFHGMARGLRRVAHPAGDFEEQFETDKDWASRLKPGDQLLVLGHPSRPQVLVDIGPI